MSIVFNNFEPYSKQFLDYIFKKLSSPKNLSKYSLLLSSQVNFLPEKKFTRKQNKLNRYNT